VISARSLLVAADRESFTYFGPSPVDLPAPLPLRTGGEYMRLQFHESPIAEPPVYAISLGHYAVEKFQCTPDSAREPSRLVLPSL